MFLLLLEPHESAHPYGRSVVRIDAHERQLGICIPQMPECRGEQCGAGRVDMTYTSAKGHALVDRALYLPRSWAEDHDRRTDAGVPEDVEFATKPALATEMITRALDTGIPRRMGGRRRSLRFLSRTCEWHCRNGRERQASM